MIMRTEIRNGRKVHVLAEKWTDRNNCIEIIRNADDDDDITVNNFNVPILNVPDVGRGQKHAPVQRNNNGIPTLSAPGDKTSRPAVMENSKIRNIKKGIRNDPRLADIPVLNVPGDAKKRTA